MRNLFFTLLAALLLCFHTTAGIGAGTDIVGEWHYEQIFSTVEGVCPPAKDISGTITIKAVQSGYELVFTTGATCSPASMCVYAGRWTEEGYLFENSDIVDDENGLATNIILLVPSGPDSFEGTVKSQYAHPSGFLCTWLMTMVLTK